MDEVPVGIRGDDSWVHGSLRGKAGEVVDCDRRHRSLPELTPEFAEECRLHARRDGPVFVSTHSTDFLNGAGLEEIFSLDQRNGVRTARRAPADERLRSLPAEGHFPGARWKQALFPGAGLD